jgi:hypothetical protein
MYFNQNDLNIIDEDLSGYTKRNELNYKKDLYIHNTLLECLIDFEDHEQIMSDNIWERSKMSKFFILNDYFIPENYKNTVLNHYYKRNLIEGFLIFANHYINLKNQIGDYYEELDFYVFNSFETIDYNYKDKKVKYLELKDYKLHFLNFIKTNLYDEEMNEVKSFEMCKNLFEIIDSNFINQIEEISIIENFYNKVFVIKYENKYYCLDKSSGS